MSNDSSNIIKLELLNIKLTVSSRIPDKKF